MNKNEKALFSELLSEIQPRLYAYIIKRMADPDGARDVLQEANLIIWKKAHEFKPGSKFIAWACTIARFQMLSYLQKRGREPLVFDNAAADSVAGEKERCNYRFEALESCLNKLSPENQSLIQTRYSKSKSVNQLAEELNKSSNAISKVLHRCRMSLLKCISAKLSEI
jgi:RNA polymerase sigma-70 factor (ECF subfamily)